MELQIQDLQQQLIEKDNVINVLENKLNNIIIELDNLKKEKNKNILSKKKYYENNKELVNQKSRDNQLKMKNENPELFKQKKREASLKYYYKKKQEKEEILN
jgi:hypothetical protein